MSANRWKRGYVTVKGDKPPEGTGICDGFVVRTTVDGEVAGPGWVVVREAPPKWCRVVVESYGSGDDARVRFIGDGHVFDDSMGILPSVIAAHGKPAPDRTKVAEMLDDWRHDRGAMLCDVLDYLCGKDGDA